MTRYRRVLAAAAFALLVSVSVPAVRAQKGTDAQIQADAQKQLSNKKFSGVHVQVQDGVVHLTGQVDRYADKEDAQKRIEKMREASSVRNDISVAGAGSVSDAELFQKLSKQLVYDRQGYASYPFNSLTLEVHDGVVTVGGLVVEPVDKDSAMGIIRTRQASAVLSTTFRLRLSRRQTIASAPRSIAPSMASPVHEVCNRSCQAHSHCCPERPCCAYGSGRQ